MNDPRVVTVDGVSYREWPLECPECGLRMTLKKDSYGVRYKCIEPCRGAHGCHPNGKPLGTPAPHRVRKARAEAHEVFDVLWKSGKLTRGQAYSWMRSTLELNEEEAHIGKMSVPQCRKLIASVQEAFPEFFPLTLD